MVPIQQPTLLCSTLLGVTCHPSPAQQRRSFSRYGPATHQGWAPFRVCRQQGGRLQAEMSFHSRRIGRLVIVRTGIVVQEVTVPDCTVTNTLSGGLIFAAVIIRMSNQPFMQLDKIHPSLADRRG